MSSPISSKNNGVSCDLAEKQILEELNAYGITKNECECLKSRIKEISDNLIKNQNYFATVYHTEDKPIGFSFFGKNSKEWTISLQSASERYTSKNHYSRETDTNLFMKYIYVTHKDKIEKMQVGQGIINITWK